MAQVTSNPTTVTNPLSQGLAWVTLWAALLIGASWKQSSRLAVAFSYLILVAVIFDTYSHHTFFNDFQKVWTDALSGKFPTGGTGTTAATITTTTPAKPITGAKPT
jgi:hypothetical protein